MGEYRERRRCRGTACHHQRMRSAISRQTDVRLEMTKGREKGCWMVVASRIIISVSNQPARPARPSATVLYVVRIDNCSLQTADGQRRPQRTERARSSPRYDPILYRCQPCKYRSLPSSLHQDHTTTPYPKPSYVCLCMCPLSQFRTPDQKHRYVSSSSSKPSISKKKSPV